VLVSSKLTPKRWILVPLTCRQTDEVLKSKGQVQFPTVIGGVVPVINIKGIAPGQIKLTAKCWVTFTWARSATGMTLPSRRSTLALPLPDASIAPVRRADGSGTTFIFTNYLSKVNPEWKSKVGEGTAVNWPTGRGWQG
jgi:phosphate transport system substrate-binding protein